jgi:hypothetical protein
VIGGAAAVVFFIPGAAMISEKGDHHARPRNCADLLGHSISARRDARRDVYIESGSRGGGVKYFGSGIVDKDGEPFDPCGMNCTEKFTMDGLVERLNKDDTFKEFAPFRLVELFYKEEE